MYLKLFKNDLKKNPWNNSILFLFMTLSVTLAVSVCLMLTQLFSSISTMYETARPPHFLQMHKGELHQEDIDAFNRSYEGIEHFQTVPMINIYGDELTVITAAKSYSLANCRLDISFVKQNESYDVLLDESRNRLEVKQGEIGVPVILLEQFPIAIGDTILLKSGNIEKSFVVSAYVYDGQMNSTLCSSTRFLISDEDFDILYGNAGETEYLIEAYFMDSSQASAYQTAYEQSEKNLPKDGQAITYTMIFLLSAMTDIMMAMVFVMVGVLLIIIAIICLRYTILAELEEDMKEIGTMKALGISGKGIRNLYLGKIRILMLFGCVVGFILSVLFTSFLTNHMRRTFGEQKFEAANLFPAVLVCVGVYGIVILFSRKILGKLRKASVTDLLVTAKGFGKDKRVVKDGIHKAKKLPTNLLLGLCEVRHGYGIVFGLLLIVAFLMVVPYRTVSTMENEEFITYMGCPVCDVLIEAEQGAGLEKRKEAAEELLQSETEQGNVTGVDILKRVRLQAMGNGKEPVGIHIDTGKNAGNGLEYLTGNRPEKENEIVLSVLIAEELEKSVGDTVTLTADGKEMKFTVSGIYQDVTSGGRTAKAVYDFADVPAEQYTFFVTISRDSAIFDDSMGSGDLVLKWRTQLGNGYSIENMDEFIYQTLGGVTMQIKRGAVTAFFIGICLTVLIILLFLKLRIAKENAALASKRAIGIPFVSIIKQELYPVLIAGGIGAVSGVIFAEVFGDGIVSLLLEMMGIGLKRIKFAEACVLQSMCVPMILLMTLAIVTVIAGMQIKRIDLTGSFNE